MKFIFGVLFGIVLVGVIFFLWPRIALFAVTKIVDCGVIVQSDVSIEITHIDLDKHRIGVCEIEGNK